MGFRNLLDLVLSIIFILTPILAYFISHFIIANRLFSLSNKMKKQLVIFDSLLIFLHSIIYKIIGYYALSTGENFWFPWVGFFISHVYLLILLMIVHSEWFHPYIARFGDVAQVLSIIGPIFWGSINIAAILHIPFLVITTKKYLDKPYKKTILPAIYASVGAWILALVSMFIISILILPFISFGSGTI